MHIHLADQYQHRRSIVHELDPRTKVVLAFTLVLTVSLTPSGAFPAYLVLWLFVLALSRTSRLGLAYVVRRSVVALPFALAAITLPFTVSGETLVELPIFGGLIVSREGAIRFASILLKAWISVQMAVALVAVTRFADLLWALRKLRVPRPLVSIVAFMYRYIFVLSDETLRLLRARAARSAESSDMASGGGLVWRGQVAGRMAGSLMLRSFERSERIYQAMVSRGYKGQMLLLVRPVLHRRDYVALLISLLVFVVAALASRITV